MVGRLSLEVEGSWAEVLLLLLLMEDEALLLMVLVVRRWVALDWGLVGVSEAMVAL